MKIFVTGEHKRLDEFKLALPESVEADFFPMDLDFEEIELHHYDAIFDLNLDDSPENLAFYSHLEGKPVIGCAVKIQLAEMVYHLGEQVDCMLFGINALPGFLNRSLWEFSAFKKDEAIAIEKLCAALSNDYKVVEDRVGMVTPRLVFMIINEAFYTLQEGTASEKDIDESMKLGTNYPHGPFEWLEMIGIQEVYETLDALYQDTHDTRYKVCPLLKTRYLKEIA